MKGIIKCAMFYISISKKILRILNIFSFTNNFVNNSLAQTISKRTMA